MLAYLFSGRRKAYEITMLSCVCPRLQVMNQLANFHHIWCECYCTFLTTFIQK
jgi:hypothetical protein